MNSTFQNNLNALKRFFPHLNPLSERRAPKGSLKSFITPSGWPTLQVRTEDGREIFLHSPSDPVSEGKRIARAIPSDRTLFLFLGCGLFYHVTAAVDLLGEEIPLFLVESKPDVFRMALETVSLVPLLERRGTVLWIGAHPEEIETELVGMVYRERLAGLSVVRSLPSFEADPSYYKDLEKRITCLRDFADCMVRDPELSGKMQEVERPQRISSLRLRRIITGNPDGLKEARSIAQLMETLAKE